MQLCDKKYALIDDKGRKVSYEELKRSIINVSKFFKKKEIVLIRASNTIDSILCYLACLYRRSVPLLVSEYVRDEIIDVYIRDYRVNIFVDMGRDEIYCSSEEFEKTIQGKIKKISHQIFGINNELSVLLPTSGSTGNSKLVRISRTNLIENTRSIIAALEINKDDIAITSLPMSYTYGLSVIQTHLFVGATVLVTNYPAYSKEFWNFFNKYSATTIAGVPYLYGLLKKMGKWNRKNKTLKAMTVAGGGLSRDEELFYIEYCEKNNLRFYIMYGQTEATARISVRDRKKLRHSIGTIGNPIPGGRLWIEDEEGNVCYEIGKVGEVVYSGKNVAMGYAETYADLKKGYEWDETLHTQDRGYFDEDGNIHLLGRKDRIAKIGGIRVNLADIEKMLKDEFQIGDWECKQVKCIDGEFNSKIQIKAHNIIHQEQDVLSYLEKKIGISRRWFYM